MRRCLNYFLLLVCLPGAASLQAQILHIPLGQQGSTYSLQMPVLGQSQQEVLRTWGDPVKRHASIGQPPITRWDYMEFSVYFEHNHVINSVRQHLGRQP